MLDSAVGEFGIGRDGTPGLAVIAAGGGYSLDSLPKFVVVEFANDTQAQRQVGWADEQQVDAVDCRDGVHFLECAQGLDLDGDELFAVRLFNELCRWFVRIIAVATTDIHSASATRRELRPFHEFFGMSVQCPWPELQLEQSFL